MIQKDELENLTNQEKKILTALGELKETEIEKIEESTDLEHPAIMRSALNLEEKNLVEIQEKTRKEIFVTEEGRDYISNSLPEKKILEILVKETSLPLDSLSDKTDIPQKKIGISIGWLKRKGWAEIENGESRILKVTEKGLKAKGEKGKDELLLEKFEKENNLFLNQINPDLRSEISTLESRGLLKSKERVERELILTKEGEKALESGFDTQKTVSKISKDLIESGKWKEVKLRKYNVTAPGPSTYPGKKHPQRRMIEKLRFILLKMGFKEINGPIVESEFWNFDALYQAQNHPARAIHDTLSLSKPEETKNINEKLLERVKKAHEDGVAGSDGWGYKFDKNISKKTILRSQTTADTVRYLSTKPEPPVKVFCIGKVFRRERIDYQHLAEFPQAEGIVMAPNLNFRHMLGYLKQILHDIGITKIRFRPGYFPYTEPSAEADGYFPELEEWIELLGAGMFRPELLEPLGIEYPVLAWGIGFSRLAMIRMGIEDMRDLHNNDLEWLKKQPLR